MPIENKYLKNIVKIVDIKWFKYKYKNRVLVNGRLSNNYKNRFKQYITVVRKLAFNLQDITLMSFDYTVNELYKLLLHFQSGAETIKNRVNIRVYGELNFVNRFKQDLSFLKKAWCSMSNDLICVQLEMLPDILNRYIYNYWMGRVAKKNRIGIQFNGKNCYKNRLCVISPYRYIDNIGTQTITYTEV